MSNLYSENSKAICERKAFVYRIWKVVIVPPSVLKKRLYNVWLILRFRRVSTYLIQVYL